MRPRRASQASLTPLGMRVSVCTCLQEVGDGLPHLPQAPTGLAPVWRTVDEVALGVRLIRGPQQKSFWVCGKHAM